jgi:micrococcal nuclease
MEKTMKVNEYDVEVIKVVDGDTVDVNIDLGFGIVLTDERVRIMGIDTPESRTSDKVEKIFGLASKARLKELLDHDAILITYDDKKGEDMKGKFGRILGDFRSGGRTVSEILIEEGHAVPYEGQSKDDIKEQHMINRQRLVGEGKVTLEG